MSWCYLFIVVMVKYSWSQTGSTHSGRGLYANVDQSPLSGRGHVTPLDQWGPYLWWCWVFSHTGNSVVEISFLSYLEGLHAKFHVNVFIVLASSGSKPQFFWQTLTIGGSCTGPLLLNEGQIWCAIADPQRTFTCQNLFRSIYSIALWRRKTPMFAGFWIRHLVISTVGGNLRKLHTGAQQQIFPYTTTLNLCLYSNVFRVKQGAQLWRSKAWRTDKKRFLPPRWRVKSDPHQTWW